MNEKKPHIVTIGGGTGSFVVLSGLKEYPVALTAIVTMMDSGGSSGRLRDELGVLPPGDVRQCLVALSQSSELLRELFNYRFEEGDLKGHNFGNIFLSALEKTTGNMREAIAEVGKILRIQGRVVPVTFDKTDLCVELTDGTIIEGETHIDSVAEEVKRAPIHKAFLKPTAKANDEAVKAILKADYVVIGPGDLYTSIIPNLLVSDIKEALQKTNAKTMYILNLMTKDGQTTDYSALDHIKTLQNYIGKNTIDYVLVNIENPSSEALAWYEEYEEYPVKDDLEDFGGQVIRTNLIKDVIIEKNPQDFLKRSIIRHDPEKLARAIMDIVNNTNA